MSIFKHHKGGLYQFIGIAQMENSKNEMVIYQSLESGKKWIRPKNDFFKKFTLCTDSIQIKLERLKDSDALKRAIEVGVKNLEQQMQLGGGNLNELFTKVIEAYLEGQFSTTPIKD